MRYWHNSTENRSIYLASSETQSIYHRNTRRKSYLIIFFREKKDNWNILLKSLSFQNICSEEAVEYSCECPCPQFSLLESKPAYSLFTLAQLRSLSHTMDWCKTPLEKRELGGGREREKKNITFWGFLGACQNPRIPHAIHMVSIKSNPSTQSECFFLLEENSFWQPDGVIKPLTHGS